MIILNLCDQDAIKAQHVWSWQVKTMRALQYFPTIEDPNTRRSLFEVCSLRSYLDFRPFCLSIYLYCLFIYFLYVEVFDFGWFLSLCFQVLQRILMGTDVVKNVNKNNASHAVLFEALALVSIQPELLFSSNHYIWYFNWLVDFDISFLFV